MGNENVECRVFVLDPGPAVLAGAPIYRDMPTQSERIRALAGALAASPAFRAMHDAVLVVRTEEPARVALLGRFSPAETSRIEMLAGIVERGLRRLRYVSYGEAELAARALAGQLVDRLDTETLSHCRFVALPRGGLFVLGMLAYLLDLRADQLVDFSSQAGESESWGGPSDAPLILVDDCALSGLRFAETLERIKAPAVVFAHLFSHPRLRDVIDEREARVVGCFAGEDLLDMADELLDEDRTTWEARWRTRSDERAYWIGLPEHVCFPWNEPDITIWNLATEAEEAPWRVVPPEFCLKNRPVAQGSGRLQEQRCSDGSIQAAMSTVYARFEGEVLAADLETGRAYAFPGIAGEIWTALLDALDPEQVVDLLAAEYDVDPARLRRDVDALLNSAVELGLLKRVDDGDSDR